MSKTLDLKSPYGYTYFGRPARIVKVRSKGEFPIIAAVKYAGDSETLMAFSLDGRAPDTVTIRLTANPAPSTMMAA